MLRLSAPYVAIMSSRSCFTIPALVLLSWIVRTNFLGAPPAAVHSVSVFLTLIFSLTKTLILGEVSSISPKKNGSFDPPFWFCIFRAEFKEPVCLSAKKVVSSTSDLLNGVFRTLNIPKLIESINSGPSSNDDKSSRDLLVLSTSSAAVADSVNPNLEFGIVVSRFALLSLSPADVVV